MKSTTFKTKDVSAQPKLTSSTEFAELATPETVTDTMPVSKDVFGDVELTKSLSMLNVFAREIITSKTVFAEPVQLELSSTLFLRPVKATSFAVTMNNWSMETVNAKQDSTESTVPVANAMPMRFTTL